MINLLWYFYFSFEYILNEKKVVGITMRFPHAIRGRTIGSHAIRERTMGSHAIRRRTMGSYAIRGSITGTHTIWGMDILIYNPCV